MIRRVSSLVVLFVWMLAPSSLLASEDQNSIKELRNRIVVLEARVLELERARSFTAFMPDMAERFHVMHRAGDAGDWAVAAHELNEMRRMAEISTAIDRDKGALMQSMMASSFDALEGAIGHGDAEKFGRALGQTVDACNGCHVATDASFIQVTLDVSDSLSMRHPHVLVQREAPGGHAH